jgi:hypothetical protein
VVVTDLDRTFTTLALRLDGEAVAAATALRGAGVRLVLATGRPLHLLPKPERLLPLFDGLVLDGGQTWGHAGAWRPLVRRTGPLVRFQARLEAAGLLVHAGEASCSVLRSDLAAARALPGADLCAFQPNVDRVDIVPRGVDKARAVQALLAAWRLPRARVAAIADGENDLVLRRVADDLVAVANAHPRLKAESDAVAPFPAAQGFAWAARRWLGADPA